MTTLSRIPTAVNPQITTPVAWLVAADPDAASFHDQAYAWGHEDGTEGNDAQGSVYYTIESLAWHCYNDGYADGLKVRQTLAQPSELDEIAFMAQALHQLRSGQREPVVRLTAAQMAEIDAETPGLYEYCNRGAF